jgi:hypothetical protein
MRKPPRVVGLGGIFMPLDGRTGLLALLFSKAMPCLWNLPGSHLSSVWAH